jgi:hypothetical protein
MNPIPTRYKNKKFVKERIRLDGQAYENCEFHECMIVIEKGETVVKDCRAHKCQLLLLGPALQIAKILQTFLGDNPLRVLDFAEPGIFAEKKGSIPRNVPMAPKARNQMILKTYCARMDHGGCGLLAHVEGGRIIKVEGDPGSPLNWFRIS